MADVEVHFDTSQFNAALRELVASSSKTPEVVLVGQARRLTFELVKHTPRASRQDIITATTPLLWKVVTLEGKGRVRVVPQGTSSRENKTAAIPYYSVGKRISAINYSKLGWYKAAEKLGVNLTRLGNVGKAAEQGEVSLKLHGEATEITITNATDGIEKNEKRHSILAKAFAGRVADM